MKSLIRKELTSILGSATGSVFALVFLAVCGLMLWFFEGSFNIPDAGYATLEKFFALAPILFIILIPALTMRLVSEEKRSGTFDLLRSRPFSISAVWFSKWAATSIFLTLIILSTTIYIYTLYTLGNPAGNIDLNATVVSYVCLMLLAGVFAAVGLFASSLTSNQVVAFVAALLMNFVIFYGFDLLSGLWQEGSVQTAIASLGLMHHFGQMQRGLVEISNLTAFAFYFTASWVASLCVLNLRKRPSKKETTMAAAAMITILGANLVFSGLRFDFTQDKRYTLTDYSKGLMEYIGKDYPHKIQVRVYLEGNLNAGFRRLRNSADELLSDLNQYAEHKIDIAFADPLSLPVAREELPRYMAERGMPGIVLNEVDRNGKVSRQMIYPYAEVIAGNDTLPVLLLKNMPGNSAEENLNASSEDLEFQFADAFRLLTQSEERSIAFIEGHGELPRPYVFDAEEALAKYYNVNRGQIGNDVSVLDDFEVVIIAGATERYTETEKYVLDQYLMRGGSILWLLDGVFVSHQDLGDKGHSAAIKNETGLDDLLFTYGIRIQPVLLQDSQCASIVVNTGTNTDPITIPHYYSPLLLPSPDHVVTKHVSDVKAAFASSINLLPGKGNETDKRVLLSTSGHSRIVPVPETIDLDIRKIQSDPHYFNNSFLPVAASLEGSFGSAFKNRPVPDSIVPEGYSTLTQSKRARMIVAASSDIIRNEIAGQGEGTQVLPLGFDRVSGREYGNRDFIVNAVNWLAGNGDIMALRNKTRALNLLNKQSVYENRNLYTIVNTVAPVLLIGLITAIVYIRRKRKYTK